MKKIYLLLLLISSLFAQKVEFEVLGSGGPEIDGRASASYIVWIDNKARILIDAGSGSMLRFEQSGARLEDLEVIVLTHMHIDHSVDLPSYIKAGYFSSRVDALEILGPDGNSYFPDIEDFLEGLFDNGGVYRYMSDVLDSNSDSFQIIPVEIDTDEITTRKYKHFSLSLTNVHHGNIPSIGVRVDIGNKSLVVSGDTNNENNSLEKLLSGVNLFVAHHAISQSAQGYATHLHMKPDEIAKVAKDANVGKVLLTHRMRRTIGREKTTLNIIHTTYKGKVIFAEDRMRVGI